MPESVDATPRPLLTEADKSESVRTQMAAFHTGIVTEICAAVEKDPVVIVGMGQNPFVKKARRALTDAGTPFTYLEYGNYFNTWRPRLAIKMWSGWPTFPQVFVKGSLIGGYEELQAMINDGSLERELG